MCRINVTGCEQAQFFTTEPSIIGQGEHHSVAERLRLGCLEQEPPLGVSGNPRQGGEARNEGTRPGTSKASTLDVPPTSNRIVWSECLFH
jgi:hypothetical protein